MGDSWRYSGTTMYLYDIDVNFFTAGLYGTTLVCTDTNHE